MMYIVPESKKKELRKPLGKVVDDIDGKEIQGKLVCVGDMVTITMIKKGIKPDIAIVDYKIERKEYKGEPFHAEEVIKVRNPPGMITRELWRAIATSYTKNKKVLIEVEGEEDLAALPAIYLAPSNTTVIYGLPSVGMVVVKVGEKERKIVDRFLKGLEG